MLSSVSHPYFPNVPSYLCDNTLMSNNSDLLTRETQSIIAGPVNVGEKPVLWTDHVAE